MEDLDRRSPRIRMLVENKPLAWPASAAAQAAAARAGMLTSHAASFALDLLREHELELPEGASRSEQPPWFLPLAMGRGQGLEQLEERVQLSSAIARRHLLRDWDPSDATTVASIAAMGDISGANRLFARFHPHARLLPLLSHVYLSARGHVPRTAMFDLYTQIGLAGEEAERAYGVHKEIGRARTMSIGGLAAVTGDTITPVTMFPVVQGTCDDPNHEGFAARQDICCATKVLAPFGLPIDGSLAAFTGQQIDLVNAARAILQSAVEHGSRVCETYGVDPGEMLDWALPCRITSGALTLAAAGDGYGNVVVLPGLDADLIRTASARGVAILARGFDHFTDGIAQLRAQLRKLSVVTDENEYLHGYDVSEMLAGLGRFELPGLDEIAPIALTAIGEIALAGHCGVAIDSTTVRYFRVQPARLRDSHGAMLDINLLARVTGDDMVVWTTTDSLSGPRANKAVLTGELQVGAASGANESLSLCLDRFFKNFMPHKMQSPLLTTRTYLSVLLMIANQGAVASLRTEQVSSRGSL